ncbi:hypothetical protein KAX75_10615 [candidate division WOR-3 bacterium]|nr:hypothetical protein [candidate division WOR-3 bacterium]
MNKVIGIIGIIFILLSIVAFGVTVWFMWKDFSFWKLIANVIATSIGTFWGLVLVLLGKKL